MTSHPPRRPPAARPARKMPPIGWLEVVVLSQTILPALLFIPAMTRVRFLTRAASFLLPLTAWMVYYAGGRRVVGGRPYPPIPFLVLAAAWLVVSLANPWINTFRSALCAVVLHVGVMCPAFWAAASIRDPRQLTRLLMLLLVCNGASTLMGIAQVYQPERFRPPEIGQVTVAGNTEDSYKVIRDDGTTYFRPFGLTDSAGGAAISGLFVCAIGLGTAISPFPWWWRLTSLGLVTCGVAILFFSQVRVMLLILILGLAAWAALLALRGEVRRLALLGALGAGLSVVAVTWVVRNGGEAVMKRYMMLTEDKITAVYHKNRGGFIERAFSEVVPVYPLGAGPGRVGMASGMFGSNLTPPDRLPLYAETQIEVWLFDGGLPLLIGEGLAILVALGSAAAIALYDRDPRISYWAGVVVVLGVSCAAGNFGGQAFMSSPGIQFWALMGALHGARGCARAEAARAAVRVAASAPAAAPRPRPGAAS